MSDDLLTRARMLAQAATPGPWITVLGSGEHLCTAIMAEREHPFDNIFVADCLPDWALEEGVAPDNHVPNMLFIEASRELVPALCDALEQARAELAQLRAENMNYAVNVCPEQDRIIAQLRAERDATDYLLAEGAEHAAVEMDGEAQRWRNALADIAHGPVGYWNLPEHRERVIKHMMEIARAALEVKP